MGVEYIATVLNFRDDTVMGSYEPRKNIIWFCGHQRQQTQANSTTPIKGTSPRAPRQQAGD